VKKDGFTRKIIAGIKELAKEYNVQRVVLFGSRARDGVTIYEKV
jgi:predicted nucleotidyltransferase